jgi:hypothetical protein
MKDIKVSESTDHDTEGAKNQLVGMFFFEAELKK